MRQLIITVQILQTTAETGGTQRELIFARGAGRQRLCGIRRVRARRT